MDFSRMDPRLREKLILAGIIPGKPDDTPRLQVDPAKLIKLPSSYKKVKGSTSRWPKGYWDHFDKAETLYTQGRYIKAKDELLRAREIKHDHQRLNDLLLLTFRKLYKDSIENGRWNEAYSFIKEMAEQIPTLATESDRKQLNKVINALPGAKRNIEGWALDFLEPAEKKMTSRFATVEPGKKSLLKVHIETIPSKIKKVERIPRWEKVLFTEKGYMLYGEVYNKDKQKWISLLRCFSDSDETFSDVVLERFRRIGISQSGDRIIGCTMDLRVQLYDIKGMLISERSITKEATDSNHVRCVRVSNSGELSMFTVANKLYLTNGKLESEAVCMMPPLEEDEGGHTDEWIYASYLSADGHRILLGTYTGRIYCINRTGTLKKAYIADDVIREIEELPPFLYIKTEYGLYVIQEERIINHVETGDGTLYSLNKWGFIIMDDSMLSFYERDGNFIAKIRLSSIPKEVIPTKRGLTVRMGQSDLMISLY